VAEQVAAERAEELKTKTLSLRSGDTNSIEEDAEKLLASGRRNSDSSDKTDYLSREQLILRRNKEVYNANGVPDASLVRGIYKRVHNGEFGKRPGKGKASSDD
jgi:hypothetical protein